MTERLEPLHPLHTPEMISEHVMRTGTYFDRTRKTGRTTIKALEYIEFAIRHPYRWFDMCDHDGGSTLELVTLIEHFVFKLSLKHIYTSVEKGAMCFGKIEQGAKFLPGHMHPLHTPEFVAEYVKNTGCYFDEKRFTGRSTALAIRHIVAAMKSPNTPILIYDHFNSSQARDYLLTSVVMMKIVLGLKHFTFNQSERSVCFGKR